MNVLQPKGLVGHEYVAGRGAHRSRVGGGPVLYCGSVLGIICAVRHLWWVSLGPSEESTRVAFSVRPTPLSSSATTTLGLGASGFI
jgi:hypothetical protein